jgi:hypothetical protein
MAGESEHILGIVNSFVLSRYRERLRLKPDDLLKDFFHSLLVKLDSRRMIQVHPISGERLARVIKLISSARTAWFLGGFAGYESGECPLVTALDMVELSTGAAASIEPGEIVFYKPELTHGRHGWEPASFLMVKDAGRLERVRRAIDAARNTRESNRVRETDEG